MKHLFVFILFVFVCFANTIESQILNNSNDGINIPSNSAPVVKQRVGDGIHCTVLLQKAGKLKSMIKDDCSEITRLNVIGEVKKNDVKFIKSLPRLKTLDASKATEKNIIYEDDIKKVTQLDTLYIPTSSSFCSYSHYLDVDELFWKISAKYYVANNVLYIREFKSANSYPGVGGFPLNKDTTLNITGTLDLTDAVHVSTYFDNTNIQRVIFSSKLKRIDGYAFLHCDKLVDLVFGESHDLYFKWESFPNHIKRIIIPKGLSYARYSANLYDYRSYRGGAVILNKIPDLALTLEVKEPGDLGKMRSDLVPQIVKLKIVGTLSFSDMETIGRMISLEELDLSEAVVNETPADKTSEAELAMLQFQLANEAQYQKDGNRDAYKLRSKMAERLEKNIEEEKSKPGSTICKLPDKAFVELPFLKKLYLPATLKEIQSSKLTKSTFLEEIWCSKKTAEQIDLKSEGAKVFFYSQTKDDDL